MLIKKKMVDVCLLRHNLMWDHKKCTTIFIHMIFFYMFMEAPSQLPSKYQVFPPFSCT